MTIRYFLPLILLHRLALRMEYTGSPLSFVNISHQRGSTLPRSREKHQGEHREVHRLPWVHSFSVNQHPSLLHMPTQLCPRHLGTWSLDAHWDGRSQTYKPLVHRPHRDSVVNAHPGFCFASISARCWAVVSVIVRA